MTKKDVNGMDKAVIVMPTDGGGLMPFGMATNTNLPLTKTEERILLEKRKQTLVIECQKEKTKLAIQSASEISQQASDAFYKSASHRTAIHEAVRDKPHQGQVEEFDQFAAQLEAQHLYRLLDAGVHLLGQEVGRSLYLPDIEHEKKRWSWLK